MSRKIMGLFSLLLVLSVATAAFALPCPRTAHYPRGGQLTLSEMNSKNNTFAFRATGKSDTRAIFRIVDGHSETAEIEVMIHLFIVNRWGNWVTFGNPKAVILSAEPSSHEVSFPIRAGRQFCFLIYSYGNSEDIVVPYYVYTK